jgi:dTDP-4-amino-4,6-dideoxygalactose transaminase
MIKIFDLKEQYKQFGSVLDKKILNILSSGNYILGKNVMTFEEKTKNYLKSKYTISCNSGTDALVLSLRALGVESGDEVITTPFSYFATAESISLTGAKPVFADINPHTYNINPKNIPNLITKKTKAILSVNLFGQACELDKINKIAKEYNIKHIEDCAQSFGATYKDRQTGSYGDMGCFSFFPTKNLGCFGDGGLISVKSKKHYDILKKLRTHGGTKRNQHDLIGYNSRLDEIQAAVLNVKLNYLESFVKKRKKIAESYSNTINNDNFKLPFTLKNSNHTYNQYTIRVKQRERFEAYLKKHKIPYGVYYSKPIYKYNAYKKSNFISLPMVEKVSKECLSLPIYPELSLKHVKLIGKILNNYE